MHHEKCGDVSECPLLQRHCNSHCQHTEEKVPLKFTVWEYGFSSLDLFMFKANCRISKCTLNRRSDMGPLNNGHHLKAIKKEINHQFAGDSPQHGQSHKRKLSTRHNSALHLKFRLDIPFWFYLASVTYAKCSACSACHVNWPSYVLVCPMERFKSFSVMAIILDTTGRKLYIMSIAWKTPL